MPRIRPVQVYQAAHRLADLQRHIARLFPDIAEEMRALSVQVHAAAEDLEDARAVLGRAA